MKDCGDYGVTIQLYLDRELSGQDLEEFRAHLEECEVCRSEVEVEEELSGLLHRLRPLYLAPDTLRERVMQAAEMVPSTSDVPVRLRKRIANVLMRPLQSAGHRAPNWVALAAAIFLIATGLLLGPRILRQSRANSYIEAPIAAHRSFLNASLPLEVHSKSPSAVTAW